MESLSQMNMDSPAPKLAVSDPPGGDQEAQEEPQAPSNKSHST